MPEISTAHHQNIICLFSSDFTRSKFELRSTLVYFFVKKILNLDRHLEDIFAVSFLFASVLGPIQIQRGQARASLSAPISLKVLKLERH